jgi:hypothetical protein
MKHFTLQFFFTTGKDVTNSGLRLVENYKKSKIDPPPTVQWGTEHKICVRKRNLTNIVAFDG